MKEARMSQEISKETVAHMATLARLSVTEEEKALFARQFGDILAYMDSKRGIVCEILGKGLEALNDPDKLKEATPAQITTAMGTLIDKWTGTSGGGSSGVRVELGEMEEYSV